MSGTVIRVENLAKQYILGHQQPKAIWLPSTQLRRLPYVVDLRKFLG